MSAVVVGAGLVSPRAPALCEHAFWIRAGIRVASPSPFLGPDDEPVRAAFCPWLGARVPLAPRVGALAHAAIAEAIAPLAAAVAASRFDASRGDIDLYVTAPPASSALDDEMLRRALAPACATIGYALRGGDARATPAPVLLRGAASFFGGIARAAERLSQGRCRVAIAVGVDSFIDVDRLAAVLGAASPWSREPPRPSEAAAALVLVDASATRGTDLETLATLVHSATRVGEGRDDDDAPTDGVAMTALLREVPPLEGSIAAAFGQMSLDSLRASDWMYASARNRSRLQPTHDRRSSESAIGRIGAAAGAANAAFVIACARHRTLDVPRGAGATPPSAPVVAWAISPNGERGLAAFAPSPPSARANARPRVIADTHAEGHALARPLNAIEQLRDAIERAREAIGSSLHARRRDALAALAAAADHLAGPDPKRSTAIERAILDAGDAATHMRLDGSLDDDAFDAFGDARDASLEPAWPRAFAVDVRAASPPLQVATDDRPALLDVARDPLAIAPRPVAVAQPAAAPGGVDAEAAASEAREQGGAGEDARRLLDDPFRVSDADVTARRAPVTLAAKSGAPMAVDAMRARVVDDAIDTLAMLWGQRRTQPLDARASREARMFEQVDAIAASGPRVVEHVLASFRASLDAPSPTRLAAVLMSLASLAGDDALVACEAAVRDLPSRSAGLVELAAEAMVLSPHPGIAQALASWQRAGHAVLRAIAIEAASLRAPARPVAEAHLADPRASVVAAALRAVARTPREAQRAPELPPRAHELMRHPDAAVAWEAARAVTLAGFDAALDQVREGAPLAKRLGARAVELFVMAGQADDLAALQRIVRRLVPSRELLLRVARFGAAGSWAFLAHHLDEPELEAAALAALTTLFGPLVEGDASRTRAAWERALADAPVDHERRFRRGVPWRPSVVAAELASLTLDAAEVDARLDELATRAACPAVMAPAPWPDVPPQIHAIELAAQKADARCAAGAWGRARG